MRFYIFCASVFFFTSVFGNENKNETTMTMLQCLGQEEAIFHQKKESGPFYRLNQTLVNALSGYRQLPLKQEIAKQCGHHKAAVPLLKYLLLEKRDIQEIDSPHILLNFLADLQSEAPPRCINGRPEVARYLTDIFYLENEKVAKNVLFNSIYIKKIFDMIDDYPNVVEKCKKEWEEKEKKLKQSVSRGHPESPK